MLFLLLVKVALADLPVHCLKHQIVGKWTLMLTSPLIKGSGELACGHDIPDNERTSWHAGFKDFKPTKKIPVTLTQNNHVLEKEQKVGKWTMVYDEGFEVDVNEYKCFAFSKYSTNYTGAYSYCGETLVGWYHNTKTNERGCYRGVKQGKNSQISQGAQNGHVVQPEFFQFKQPQTNKIWTKRDAEDVVKQLNSANLKWKAKVYDNFVGLSTKQINDMAGRRKSENNMLIEKVNPEYSERYDVSHLPKQFSWEKYIGKTREQKQCGSCYSISTMAMLSARSKIKLEKQGQKGFDLSPQQSLDCNYFNQGCNGGYPYLVSRFGWESHFVLESDYPYTGVTGKCKSQKELKQFKVKHFKFIGGAYGKSNELNIMEEIHKHGPVVLNFEPQFDFMFYVGGIYHSTVPDWIVNGMQRPEWEKVDHSVLCYGWGEEDGEKYWLLQNSWGRQWGENGNFRMRRGTDESAIESMAEAADLDL